MEHTARRFLVSFYNSAPLFTLLSNGVIGSRTRAALSKASARERSPTKQYLWRQFLLFIRRMFAGARFAERSIDLINIQNKYTRGWYLWFMCDITVSGGRHNRFRGGGGDITVSCVT